MITNNIDSLAFDRGFDLIDRRANGDDTEALTFTAPGHAIEVTVGRSTGRVLSALTFETTPNAWNQTGTLTSVSSIAKWFSKF